MTISAGICTPEDWLAKLTRGGRIALKFRNSVPLCKLLPRNPRNKYPRNSPTRTLQFGMLDNIIIRRCLYFDSLARQNTAQLVRILHDTTHYTSNNIRYIYFYKNKALLAGVSVWLLKKAHNAEVSKLENPF